MSQRKLKPSRAGMPNPPPLRPAAAALRRPSSTADSPLPMIIGVGLICLVLFVQVIVLWFTSLTYLLDEIKVTLFFIMGPIAMLLAATAIFLKKSPWPSRSIGYGLLAYFIIVVLSTCLSDYSYIGKYYIVFTWAAGGFFMLAFVAGANRRASYHLFRYLTILLLIEALIGFFMYDVTHSPNHNHSGIALLKTFLFGNSIPYERSNLFNLLHTLSQADDQLQSTILNRDFFAGFCCMLVPFPILLSFYPGPTRHPLAWRLTGIVTAILGSFAIYFCQSKGEWLTWGVAIVFFVAMMFKIGFFKPYDLARHHLLDILVGGLILVSAITWMSSPTLLNQLGSTSESIESRKIIWSGAWKIFKENPHNVVIGGGPGTFRIYFSSKRRPDYYEHGINNVTTLAHNYFMDLLSETGLLGLLAFCIFLGSQVVLSMFHALRRSNDLYLRLTLTGTLTGLMSMYSSNMTSPSARWVIGATPMWVVMGLLSGLIHQSGRENGDSASEKLPSNSIGATPMSNVLNENLPPTPKSPLALAIAEYSPIALLLVGCLMLGYGSLMGVNYFRSQKEYAVGLSLLEEASKRYVNANGNVDDTSENELLQYFTESTKYFNHAIDIDETNTSAYYKIGSAYTYLSQLYEHHIEVAASKGKMQEAQNAMDQSTTMLKNAMNSYERLMEKDPDYAEIHYNMGLVYEFYADYLKRGIDQKVQGSDFTMANYQKYREMALENLQKMGKTSNKPEVAVLLGTRLISMDRKDKARDVFREAAKRPSADDQMIKNYYETAMSMNPPDYASACDGMLMAWLRRPGNETLLDQLVMLARQNHFDDVLKAVIDRLEHINPVHSKLFEAKIDLAMRHGTPDELIAAVEGYIKCDGQDLTLYQLGAQTAEKAGKLDKARAFNMEILSVDRGVRTDQGKAAKQWLSSPAAMGTPPAPAAPPAKKP